MFNSLYSTFYLPMLLIITTISCYLFFEKRHIIPFQNLLIFLPGLF